MKAATFKQISPTMKQNTLYHISNVVKMIPTKKHEKKRRKTEKESPSWPENLKKREYGNHCTVPMYLLKVLKQKLILPVRETGSVSKMTALT